MGTMHAKLAPYTPSPADPFDATKAAHLMNRAGFGGTADELERVLQLGPQNAVDWLLDFPDAPADELSQDDLPDLTSVDGYPRNFREYRKLLDMKSRDE